MKKNVYFNEDINHKKMPEVYYVYFLLYYREFLAFYRCIFFLKLKLF